MLFISRIYYILIYNPEYTGIAEFYSRVVKVKAVDGRYQFDFLNNIK
jgi:hypothetical protein